MNAYNIFGRSLILIALGLIANTLSEMQNKDVAKRIRQILEDSKKDNSSANNGISDNSRADPNQMEQELENLSSELDDDVGEVSEDAEEQDNKKINSIDLAHLNRYHLKSKNEHELHRRAKLFLADANDQVNSLQAINILTLLVKYGSVHSKPEYIYCLALAHFNYNYSSFRDLHFREALNLFVTFYNMKHAKNYGIRAPKALIRAAFAAHFIHDYKTTSTLVQLFNKEFPKYKCTEIENAILKRIKPK